MINKYTNKQRGLLAVIMAMVMVFAGAAFVAAEVDATDNVAIVTSEGGATETPYTSLEAAITAASGASVTSTVTILKDCSITTSNFEISNSCDLTITGGDANILKKITVTNNIEHTGAGALTFENISFNMVYDESYENTGSAIKNMSGAGALTFEGCVFEGDSPYAIQAYENSTEMVTVKDTNLNGKKLTATAAGAKYVLDNAQNTYLHGAVSLRVVSTDPTINGDITVKNNTTFTTITVTDTLDINGNSISTNNLYIRGTDAKIVDNASSSTATLSTGTIAPYEGQPGKKLTIGAVKISGNTILSGSFEVVFDGTIITDKAKLTVTKDVTAFVTSNDLENQGILNLYANVSGNTDNKINNTGTVNILSNDITGDTIITGGNVDTSAVNSNVNIDGDVSGNVIYNMYQTVTVVGDMNIVDKGVLTVNGTLIIKEGVTLTIEDGDVGGQLVVDSIYGKVQNYGTIIVENSLTITGATVENYGTIIADSDKGVADNPIESVSIITGTLVNEGTFEVSDDDLVDIGGSVVNKAGASFNIYGELDIDGDIQNSGDIAIDGTVEGIINQMGDGAVVQIIELKGVTADLIVTDVEFTKVGKNNLENETNSVTISSVEVMSGLVITTTVFTETDDNGSKTYHKEMILAGSIVNDSEADSISPITVEVASTHMVVEDNLSVGEDVIFINISAVDQNSEIVGAFTVDGTMSVSKKNVTVNNDDGKIIVNGTITTDDYDINTGQIVAVEYIVVETGTADKTYYYTTLANAIDGASAAGVKKVEILGNIVIKTDVTVPAGMTVKQTATEVTIGDKEDVTVTVSEGAKIDTPIGTDVIDVAMGTLYITDKKTGITKNADVESEVKSEGEKDLRYTTLANAIAAAGSDVVTIELNGPVTVKSDLTIPANVTVDTKAQNFNVQGATLTIDGTLFLNGGTYTVTDVVNDSNGTTSEGKVILNGYMKSENMMTYDGKAYPAGAYHAEDLVYYITSVANSVNIINDADEEVITIFGSNKVGDIAYTGTSDDPITINVKGDLEAKSVTVDEGTIEFFGNKFIGSITNGVGTVALNGTALNGFKVVSATDSEGTEKFTLAGGFNVDTTVKDNVVTISGKTILNGFEATPIIIDGEVDVIKTVTLTDVTVNGTMTIDNAQTLNVTNAYVFGSIITDAPTTSKVAGAFIATYLYLGLEADDVKKNLGAVATVDGNIKVNGVMYVLAGSAFPADLVEEDTPAVELYVEGKLWMTIYNFNNSPVTVNQIPVENVEFMGWAKKEGKPGYTVDGTTVNKNFTISFANEKYYADIKYDIYKVSFVKAEGIDDVYIDGVLIKEGTTVAAGQHTVSYTLANGYTGEAKMLVDGKEVSGLTFTVGGDDLDYAITLQGIEKAPAEVGGGDAPVADKDEGMDLTDILLIVLVVLIVIMAIIVALRMMRS